MTTRPVPLDVLWFRRAFDDAGLSQNEVAARIHMDRSAFSRTLWGARRLQLNEAKRLASVLGVSQAELLSHAGGTTAPVDVAGASTAVVSTSGLVAAPLGGMVKASTGAVQFLDMLPDASVLALAVQGDESLAGQHLLINSDITSPASATKGMGVLQLSNGRLVVGKFKPAFEPGRFDIGPVLGFGRRVDSVGIVGLYELVGMALDKV